MGLTPLARPAYLDQASPKAALISFHSEQARFNREQLTEQMLFDMQQLRVANGQFPDDYDWWKDLETRKWEDGSVTAVWRDRMRFHERCVEFLTNG